MLRGLNFEWLLRGRRESVDALRLVGRAELSRLRYEQLPSEAIIGRIVSWASSEPIDRSPTPDAQQK